MIVNCGRWALLFLAVAFGGRVLAQLVQRFAAVDVLPAFDAWQSGAVPYSVLLAGQVAILAVAGVVTVKAWHHQLWMSPLTVRLVGGFGATYFVFMAVRLVAGQSFASGHSWWDAPLPSVFHLVLASFMLATSIIGARSR